MKFFLNVKHRFTAAVLRTLRTIGHWGVTSPWVFKHAQDLLCLSSLRAADAAGSVADHRSQTVASLLCQNQSSR